MLNKTTNITSDFHTKPRFVISNSSEELDWTVWVDEQTRRTRASPDKCMNSATSKWINWAICSCPSNSPVVVVNWPYGIFATALSTSHLVASIQIMQRVRICESYSSHGITWIFCFLTFIGPTIILLVQTPAVVEAGCFSPTKHFFLKNTLKDGNTGTRSLGRSGFLS